MTTASAYNKICQIHRWCHGSPVHRYGLYALQWIVEINGKPTPNIDSFVNVYVYGFHLFITEGTYKVYQIFEFMKIMLFFLLVTKCFKGIGVGV